MGDRWAHGCTVRRLGGRRLILYARRYFGGALRFISIPPVGRNQTNRAPPLKTNKRERTLAVGCLPLLAAPGPLLDVLAVGFNHTVCEHGTSCKPPFCVPVGAILLQRGRGKPPILRTGASNINATAGGHGSVLFFVISKRSVFYHRNGAERRRFRVDFRAE